MRYKKRSGYAQQIQLLGQSLLKEILYGFDCDLGIMKIQVRAIPGRYIYLVHGGASFIFH